MTRRDPRGNPVATDSAAALDASERALWRMMSFYGTPIDDLGVLQLARAWEQLRPTPRPWPEPPAA